MNEKKKHLDVYVCIHHVKMKSRYFKCVINFHHQHKHRGQC